MKKSSKIGAARTSMSSLGMDRPITRRDFLNASLIGSGSMLLNLTAPRFLLADTSDWDGYGGEGEYGGANGNTRSIVRTAHDIRDGVFDAVPANTRETDEVFDLVIVGGGISGLGAAHHFLKAAKPGSSCLILENHEVVGGEARRNEFHVNGSRLFGPQGANSFAVPREPGHPGYAIYRELGIPERFDYVDPSPDVRELWFDRTNYGFMLWFDAPSVGHFFRGENEIAPGWVTNFWREGLSSAPYSERVRNDFLRWRKGPPNARRGPEFHRWLDTMTYRSYLESFLELDRAVSEFGDPIVASSLGLGSDAVSAYAAYQIGMPGFAPFTVRGRVAGPAPWHSFPGGIDAIPRYLLRALIPASLPGGRMDEVYATPINRSALDTADTRVRIRLGTTVVRVEHFGDPDHASHVQIVYVRNGQPFTLRAKAVVLTGGSWVSRRVVRDLPADFRDAFGRFVRAPMLVVNVALTNWRFLSRMGLTACRWYGGFGFACNIRQPMAVKGIDQPLDPGKPVVLTFYVPFHAPGLLPRQQGIQGRAELLSTSFRTYERKIREQMEHLFGPAGFDPKRDIAGIILNRWGHAYVAPEPGFYFGTQGRPAPRDVIRRGFGRIAFGNAELNGHQHWVAAVEEGARATDRVLQRASI